MTGPGAVPLKNVSRDDLEAFVYGLAAVIGGYAIALDLPTSRGLGARDLMLIVANGVGDIQQVGAEGGKFAQATVRAAFDLKTRPKKGGHLKAV